MADGITRTDLDAAAAFNSRMIAWYRRLLLPTSAVASNSAPSLFFRQIGLASCRGVGDRGVFGGCANVAGFQSKGFERLTPLRRSVALPRDVDASRQTILLAVNRETEEATRNSAVLPPTLPRKELPMSETNSVSPLLSFSMKNLNAD
jgi:hypothetical protein